MTTVGFHLHVGGRGTLYVVYPRVYLRYGFLEATEKPSFFRSKSWGLQVYPQDDAWTLLDDREYKIGSRQVGSRRVYAVLGSASLTILFTLTTKAVK